MVNGSPFFVKGVAHSPNWNNACCLASPLGQSQQSTWTSDLAQWRSMGVSAIHVYNVSPTTMSNLDPFLNAAYTGGTPVYVMLEWHFGAPGNVACNQVGTNTGAGTPTYPNSTGQYVTPLRSSMRCAQSIKLLR
jgi:hypothetical protein